jgi:hypothetical protein
MRLWIAQTLNKSERWEAIYLNLLQFNPKNQELCCIDEPLLETLAVVYDQAHLSLPVINVILFPNNCEEAMETVDCTNFKKVWKMGNNLLKIFTILTQKI